MRLVRGETNAGQALAPIIRSKPSTNKLRNPAAVERLVKASVLPRMALVRAAQVPVGDSRSPGAFAWHEVLKFADAAVASDESQLLENIQGHVARGRSLEAVYLELMHPAARHLGDRWADDTLDFATVTLGLCQMHRAVRELGPVFQAERRHRSDGCHALLTPAGNEQHSLGLTLVGEFLRREGWLVTSGPFGSDAELVAAVKADWLTFVGFSLSCDSGLTALASQIRSVRRASLNPAVWVLVGGRVFVDRPEYAARIGADAMGCDAKQAAMISRRLAAMHEEGRT